MQDKIKILFVGDVVGQLGRAMFQKHIPLLKRQYKLDSVIVNGENSHSSGRGITPKIVKFFRQNGADAITTGNHIWARKEIYSYLAEHNDVLRPANFPSTCPGVGVTTFKVNDIVIGVINLQGRIFMKEFVEDPFKTAESILTYLKSKTNIILVDMHAEATSEKIGIAYYLDGKVSAVVGTHTHVQTADERILPHGTAFISDLGFCGAYNSMIGMRKETVLQTFLTQMPSKFEVDINPPGILCAVLIEINLKTGKTTDIERIQIIDDEISVESIDSE